jgi:GAF domain-containing protein
MFEARSTDQRLVEVVTAVTSQLGAILQLKQAEQALRESEPAIGRFLTWPLTTFTRSELNRMANW